MGCLEQGARTDHPVTRQRKQGCLYFVVRIQNTLAVTVVRNMRESTPSHVCGQPGAKEMGVIPCDWAERSCTEGYSGIRRNSLDLGGVGLIKVYDPPRVVSSSSSNLSRPSQTDSRPFLYPPLRWHHAIHHRHLYVQNCPRSSKSSRETIRVRVGSAKMRDQDESGVQKASRFLWRTPHP